MRRLRALAVALAAAAVLSVLAVAPAKAQTADYILSCNGHNRVAYHRTAAGNEYTMYAHNCIREHFTGTFGEYRYYGRAHWHCYRNGQPWDGCRINSRQIVQRYTGSINGWVGDTTTIRDISYPGGSYSCNGSGGPNTGFFTDSTTQESLGTGINAWQGYEIRGASHDPDNMRFCLADGSTIVKDVTNSVSLPWTAS